LVEWVDSRTDSIVMLEFDGISQRSVFDKKKIAEFKINFSNSKKMKKKSDEKPDQTNYFKCFKTFFIGLCSFQIILAKLICILSTCSNIFSNFWDITEVNVFRNSKCNNYLRQNELFPNFITLSSKPSKP